MSEPKDQEHSEVGDMPMLAGSAAARLAKSVLSRLASPFAQPSATPIHPSALWRQIGRRLGALPEDEPRHSLRPHQSLLSRPARQGQQEQMQDQRLDPFSQYVQRSRSDVELVWHTTHHGADDESDQRTPKNRSILSPTRITPVTLPQSLTARPPHSSEPPTLSPPSQPAPSQALMNEQLAPTQSSAMQAEAATSATVPPITPTTPATPDTVSAQPAPPIVVEQPPTPLAEAQSPPVLVPARVVTVEYVPGPAVLPQQPLTAAEPLFTPQAQIIEQPRLAASVPLAQPVRSLEPMRGLDTRVARNLASEVNRELVPDTDLLSRMTRATNIELSPAPPPAQPAPPSPVPTPDSLPPIFPTTNATEAPRLEMPLIPQQGAPKSAQQAANQAGRAADTVGNQTQGPIGRFFERVVESLPEPVRRFFGERDNEQRDQQPAPPAPPQTPPSPEAATSQTQPVTTQPASEAQQSETSHPTPVQPTRQDEFSVTQPPAMPLQRGSNKSQDTPPVSPSLVADRVVARLDHPPMPGTPAPAQQPLLMGNTRDETTSVPDTFVEAVQSGPAAVQEEPGYGSQPAARWSEAQSQQTPTSSKMESDRDPQSLLSSLVSRILGRGGQEKEGSGPPAIEMPWARSKYTPEQGGAPRSEQPILPAASATTPSTPTTIQPQQAAAPTSGIPTQPPAEAQPPQAQPAQSPPPVEATTVTQGAPTQSQPSTPEPVLSAASALPTAVETSIQQAIDLVASTEMAEPSPPPGTSSHQPQVSIARETEATVVQASRASEAPQPLPMPLAPRVTRAEPDDATESPLAWPAALEEQISASSAPTPVALEPSAIPTYTIEQGPMDQQTPDLQLPPVPPALPIVSEQPASIQTAIEQPTALTSPAPASAQRAEVAEQQAWETFSQIAQELAKAHIPLAQSAPLETTAQSELLSRLLEGPSRLGRAWEGMTAEPSAVPAPLTGVGADLPLARALSAQVSQQSGEASADRIAIQASPGTPHSTLSIQTSPATQTAYSLDTPLPSLQVPIGSTAAQSLVLANQQSLTRPTLVPETLRDIRTGLPTLSTLSPAFPAPTGTMQPQTAPAPHTTFRAPHSAEPLSLPQRPTTAGDAPSVYSEMRPTATLGDPLPSALSTHPAAPTIMRSVAQMAPSMGGRVETELETTEGSVQPVQDDKETPWMNTLRELYGSSGEDQDMPLAIPYGAFALPREEAGPVANWMQETLDQVSGDQASASSLARLTMPLPSIPATGYPQSSRSSVSIWSAPPSWEGGLSAGVGSDFSTESYGSDSFDSSYGDGTDAETDAWAGIIADAASDVGAATPALALAGEERSTSNETQQAEESDKPPAGPDLDDLAESVYVILRRRLAVERERDFA